MILKGAEVIKAEQEMPDNNNVHLWLDSTNVFAAVYATKEEVLQFYIHIGYDVWIKSSMN